MGREYTIKEAAEILEISTSTVRRRIKSGELEAELKESPYGEQYFIPDSELDQAVMDKEVTDIKKLKKPVAKEEIIKAIKEAQANREQELLNKVNNTIENREERLKQAISARDEKIDQLQESIEELHEKMDKSWWDKLKDWFKK